jgi:hypothetical protein
MIKMFQHGASPCSRPWWWAQKGWSFRDHRRLFTGIARCWARAVSGNVITSNGFKEIAAAHFSPKPQDHADRANYIRDLRPAK